jgi:hypothetical protein
MSFITPELVTIAGFQLLKLGSLKRKEMAFINKHRKEIVRGYMEVNRIALEISEKYEITEAEALSIVNNFGLDGGNEALLEYTDRLIPLVELLTTQDAQPGQAVSMLLRSRLSPDWLKDNAENLLSAFGIKVEETGIWRDEFIDELTEQAIDSLYKFLIQEQNEWKAPEPEQPKTLGEELPSTENSSNSTPIEVGMIATGESSSPQLEIPLSIEPTSTNSHVTSSSAPSPELPTTVSIAPTEMPSPLPG